MQLVYSTEVPQFFIRNPPSMLMHFCDLDLLSVKTDAVISP